DAPAPRSFVHIVGVALDALAHMLQQDSEDEPERSHSVALLAASLPPAVRAECSASLRTVASLISEAALDELHVSPSPHARAGARLMAELLAGNSLPAGEEPPPWHATAEAAPSAEASPSVEAI